MILQPLGLFLVRADDLLRGNPIRLDTGTSGRSSRTFSRLLLTTVVFGMTYGATMGTFGGLHGGLHDGLQGGRWLQLVYSAGKVPLLLGVSFCLGLPSFFILNTIAGLREDFAEVAEVLLATQAGLTIVLASLAPLTAFWYLSCADYDSALTFNGTMFFVATLSAQWMLRRRYRPLIARNPRHRLMLRLWLVVYSFVAIQMAWVLRPFVGSPGAPVGFFRHDAWGNAYVELLRVIGRAVGM